MAESVSAIEKDYAHDAYDYGARRVEQLEQRRYNTCPLERRIEEPTIAEKRNLVRSVRVRAEAWRKRISQAALSSARRW